MNALLHALKRETWPLHERLERRLNLLGPAFTAERYVGLIIDFWGFYSPLESRLANLPGLREWMPDLERRFKTPQLEADLANLGIPPETFASIPLCAELPPLQGMAQALGCLYVLEGATLGGQVVSRHLRRSLGFEADNGASFFQGYGDRTGTMWRIFGERLAAVESVLGPIEAEMTDAARATFETLERWLFRQPPYG